MGAVSLRSAWLTMRELGRTSTQPRERFMGQHVEIDLTYLFEEQRDIHYR